MATRRVATVFGGSGFIGRHVVKRLAHAGYVVRVAVRYPEGALFLKPTGAVGQVVPLAAPVTNEGAVHRAIEGADLVVNLVGILAEPIADGHLMFAGEACNTPYAGTVAGAWISGQKAAHSVMGAL